MKQRATFHEYTAAADPSTFMSAVPLGVFPAELHEAVDGKTGVLHLDASAALTIPSPATTPNLAAAFVRIRPTESVVVRAPSATSHLFYVIRGDGESRTVCGAHSGRNAVIVWHTGDLFTIPAVDSVEHSAITDSALYWVNDAPLLQYLGAVPTGPPKFETALYTREALTEEMARVNADAEAGSRNRNGVLLGNEGVPKTRTLTHTLWALYNQLPAHVTQPPHRLQSVALDLCVSAGPGTYTLMSPELDGSGRLVNPIRADWRAGAVFVTPPGWWHSHHNESDVNAIVLPVQVRTTGRCDGSWRAPSTCIDKCETDAAPRTCTPHCAGRWPLHTSAHT